MRRTPRRTARRPPSPAAPRSRSTSRRSRRPGARRPTGRSTRRRPRPDSASPAPRRSRRAGRRGPPARPRRAARPAPPPSPPSRAGLSRRCPTPLRHTSRCPGQGTTCRGARRIDRIYRKSQLHRSPGHYGRSRSETPGLAPIGFPPPEPRARPSAGPPTRLVATAVRPWPRRCPCTGAATSSGVVAAVRRAGPATPCRAPRPYFKARPCPGRSPVADPDQCSPKKIPRTSRAP